MLNGKLFDIHLATLLMYDSHNEENCFQLVSKFLNALCPKWKKKLISISTDGASYMHGHYQGLVSRLDRVCEDGFYRIWRGAHQLDSMIQAIFRQLLNSAFVEQTHMVTVYLRRQVNLRSMGSKAGGYTLALNGTIVEMAP